MSKRRLGHWATSLLLAGLVGGALLMPMTFAFHWIDPVTPVMQYVCPETGKLAHPNRRRLACLDAEGRHIESRETNRRFGQSVWLFWTLVPLPAAWALLYFFFYPPQEPSRNRRR